MINIIKSAGRCFFMADVKCSRCDRYYSMFRSRCPYCGTLRSSKGKRAVNNDNAKWKVIVGISIFVILIGAVAAILYMTYAPVKETPTSPDPEPVVDTPNSDAGGVVTEEGEDPVPSGPTSLSITYGGEVKTDITMKANESIKMSAAFEPADYSGGVIWSTSDANVITTAQDGTVMAIGAGTARLILTAGDVTAECIVRVY